MKIRLPNARSTLIFFIFFLFLLGFVVGVVIASATVTSYSNASSTIIRIIPVGQYDHQYVKLVLGVNNTLTWVNGDLVSHSVTADSGLFDSSLIAPNHQWTFTFNKPGTYSYHCSVHPWMKGVVTVVAA